MLTREVEIPAIQMNMIRAATSTRPTQNSNGDVQQTARPAVDRATGTQEKEEKHNGDQARKSIRITVNK